MHGLENAIKRMLRADRCYVERASFDAGIRIYLRDFINEAFPFVLVKAVLKVYLGH